jgi:hypothetical protein
MQATVAHAQTPVAAPATSASEPRGDNVVPIRLKLLPRHREHLRRWLKAGSRMGLLDAGFEGDDGQDVLIWVRESAEPAYLVRAERMNWVVLDGAGTHRLGAFRAFEAALHCIRPVLSQAVLAKAG